MFSCLQQTVGRKTNERSHKGVTRSAYIQFVYACICIFAGMSGFLEHCRGQAVGAVGRKHKKNGMVMRDTATLYEFCGSFR